MLFRTEDGNKVKTEISAADFIECSALKNENILEVFLRASKLAIENKKEKKRGCCLIL